jgi:hypothetical protein
MRDTGPPILVVVRASPIRDRTTALLESIASQKATGTVKVVVLSQRRIATGFALPLDNVEYLDAEPAWTEQVLRLAAASGSRWLVLPSSVDRYLPGTFEAVAALGPSPGATIVGACQVARGSQVVTIGPEPFRFDYFALLSGLNYIAPGATFIDIGRLLQAGGLDARLASCSIYEYLLRTAAAGGVVACPVPIVETEADPFPGIPSDWAALHASEALLLTLNHNRFFVTSGAALGLLATLADRLEPYQYTGFHDSQVLSRLAGAAADLKQRYIAELRLATTDARLARPAAAAESELGFDYTDPLSPRRLRSRVKSRVKSVTPRPIWDTLRRAKRAYLALRSPLY